MKKEEMQKALNIGKVRGIAFILNLYLENILEINNAGEGFDLDTKGYLKDTHKEIKRLQKIASKL